jgi:uncharacterized protein
MDLVALETDDPRVALDRAGPHLSEDPVGNNLILTLLRSRVAHPEPGRYWIVADPDRVHGVVFQSPLSFVATLTPMADEVAACAVDAIVDAGAELPGVHGEATTAARFAGRWSERTKSPAYPVQGQRLYELEHPSTPRAVGGSMRPAEAHDRSLLVEWLDAFQHETGQSAERPTEVVDRRLRAGQLWVWDDEGPVALTAISAPVDSVSRIGPVYTPPERRTSGYGSALVAAVSNAALARGERCILYTDLGNPTSNSIYRAIGYRCVSEVLRYRFDPPQRG